MSEVKVRAGSVLAIVMDEANRSIVFNVAGAAPDGGSKSITLSMAKVHADNVAYAAMHGMKQRLGDMAALSRVVATGKAATPADKFAAIARGVEHYESGTDQWNMKGSSERTDGELVMLAEVISKLKSKPLEEVSAWLKTKSASERKALTLAPAIKPRMDELRAEASKGVDSEAMLAELGE